MISRREWSYMANFLVSPSFVSVSFLSLVLGPSQLTTSFFFAVQILPVAAKLFEYCPP